MFNNQFNFNAKISVVAILNLCSDICKNCDYLIFYIECKDLFKNKKGLTLKIFYFTKFTKNNLINYKNILIKF